MPHIVSKQPAMHWEAPSRCAGDPKETTDSWAQANGPRQTKQLQEILPELTDPTHSQGKGSEVQPPASAALQRGRGVHCGHETSESPASEYAEEKQREVRHRGAQSEALQSPGAKLHTGKTQTEQEPQPAPDPQVELQDEENREEAGGGDEKTVTSDKEEMSGNVTFSEKAGDDLLQLQRTGCWMLQFEKSQLDELTL